MDAAAMNPFRDYSNSSRGDHELSAEGGSAKAVVADVLERRAQGHPITDGQVLAAHPELGDELKRELLIADQIRQAMLSTRYAATPQKILGSLTDSEFDASVAAIQNRETEELPGRQESLPRIPGYLLVREINRGGQAAVYQAIQESTKRDVAVKVMSGGPFAGSRHRVRFEREARILATLDHPNIVSIIERARTPDGSFFFVMQYIDGLPLDEHWTSRISRQSGGARDLVQLFIKIANAVEEAHGRGILHRDLKPSNIIVDHRGEPHILDFGLARPIDDLFDIAAQTITMPGQIIGSLPWVSPEQAAGQSKQLNALSDIYSIGVMLYQALTGDFPYSLKGPVDEVLQRIRNLKAEAPSKHTAVRSNVDRRLDAIVLKALAKLPQDRYDSAQSLASDLEAWLSGNRALSQQTKSAFDHCNAICSLRRDFAPCMGRDPRTATDSVPITKFGEFNWNETRATPARSIHNGEPNHRGRTKSRRAPTAGDG
jgi:serine/threonine protein kinase